MAEALWRKMFVEEANPNWKKRKLGDFCERITKGTTPTTLKMNFVEEGINFVKVESIDDNGQFIAEKFAHIDEETNTLLQRSILKENDILYSIAGTIGRIAVVTEEILPANTNQALAIIRLKNIELYLPFVRLLLKTSDMTNDLSSKIVHAVQPNLSLGKIAETEFNMPYDRSLIVFNSKVNGLYSKSNANTQQIRTLSRMRDTLLPKLMSGEVRVRI
jgi:type I restriction enzyme S subunit